jgi:hypothetical protein
MSYQISPHLDRAKRLIEAGDEQSLVYAALELRLGLEVVCYEKLRLRLEYVSPEDIRDWRPKQVLEALQELVEARIFEPAILERAEEPVGEEPRTWVQVGERKAMAPRRWGEIWNKLGRYLHAQEPAGRDTPVRAYPAAVSLKKILLDVIEDLEPLASAGDINFPGPVTYFHCTCGMRVQRPNATLQPGQVITCFNPNCLREWVVRERRSWAVRLSKQRHRHCVPDANTRHLWPRRILRRYFPTNPAHSLVLRADRSTP